jgi:hypothetical protein
MLPAMGTEIIRKSDFAERCGVSPAAITKALKGPLGDALVAKMIDAKHPAAIKYAKGREPKSPTVTKVASDEGEQKAKVVGRASVKAKTEEKLKLEGYYSLTLLEIVQEHGSQTQFEGWLRSAKLMEEVREKQTKNFEREGKLVDRDLVKLAVVVPYDAAHKALLNDVSKTIAARSSSMAKAGSSNVEVEKFIVEIISKTLQRATVKVREALGESSTKKGKG